MTKKIIGLVLILTVLIFFSPQTASAAGLSVLSDTMTRLATTTLSNHDLKFRTTTGMSSGTATLDFNTGGFSAGSVNYTDIDLQYGSSQAQVNGACSSSCTKATLAAAAGSGAWGAVFATNTLTFTYPTSGGTAIASNDYTRVLIGTNAVTGETGDQQMTNPGTTGTKVITITLPSDSGKLAIAIANPSDQFTVSATVDPTITLQIDNISTAFGTITSTGVTTSSPNITLTVSTNATSGYSVTIQDAGNATSPGLYNATASAIIGSADASYNNSADLGSVAGYGIQCSSASATCASPYNVSGTNVGGYELTATPFASFDGPADAHAMTITSKAKATGSSPAGSYADTATVIATGNF